MPRINDYIRCPCCGFFHITEYTLKAGTKRRSTIRKTFSFNISLDEDVTMWQKREMVPAGPDSQILIHEDRNLYALPDNYKDEIVDQCRRIIKALKGPATPVVTPYSPVPKPRPAGVGVVSPTRRAPGVREHGARLAGEQIDIIEDAIKLADLEPDSSLKGIKNVESKDSLDNVIDALGRWTALIEDLTRKSKIDRAMVLLLNEIAVQLVIASEGKNDPTPEEIKEALDKAKALLLEIAEERVEVAKRVSPPPTVVAAKPDEKEEKAKKVKKLTQKELRAEQRRLEKAQEKREAEKVTVTEIPEEIAGLEQYDSLPTILVGLNHFGSLRIEDRVSFGTAWLLYPRLIIESRKDGDYITDIYANPQNRPDTGCFANPPDFLHAPDYEEPWMKYLEEELLGIGEFDPEARPDIYGSLVADIESIMDRVDLLEGQEPTGEVIEELQKLGLRAKEVERMISDIEKLG